MNFVEIDFSNGHLVPRIVEIIFEQLEIAFKDFADQMHRQVIEIILNGMRTLWPVSFALVEAGDGRQINTVRRLDRVEHVLHAVVKTLGPDDLVVLATVHNECAHMTCLTRPVNVGVHRAAPPNCITRKQQKATEARDLVEFLFSITSTNFDPVFLDQEWD